MPLFCFSPTPVRHCKTDIEGEQQGKRQAGVLVKNGDELAEAEKSEGHSLLTATEDWLKSARELGDLYAKREVLRGEDNPEAVTAAQIHAERNRWIRGVNAMTTMLEETDIDSDLRRRLLVNLHHAERQADLAQKPSQQPDDGSQPDNVDFDNVQNSTSEPV